MLPAQSGVSVALCTHNGEEFIAEQVRSICAQTLIPDEIVLSDDASTDATVDIAIRAVSEFQTGARPVLRVLRNRKALGVTANFAQAIAACSGEFIALSDQDDVWVPVKIERMLEVFRRQSDLLLLHTDARLVDSARRPIGYSLFLSLEVQPAELERLHHGQAFEVYLRRNLVTGATSMIRRSVLRAVLPFPPCWLHDEWLGAVASSIGRVDVLEELLIDYRQHGRNLIGARKLGVMETVAKAFAPRGATHIERARKAEIWLSRLNELIAAGVAIDAGKYEAINRRFTHQKFRATLPRGRLARVVPVLRELRTGNYSRFGRGYRGVIRDIFEPV